MKTKPDHIMALGVEAARQSLLNTVKTRYFPEIWYAVENWFLTLKTKRVLVIGNGFGLIATALAKSGWNVTVVDPSIAALTDLKDQFAKNNLVGTFQQSEPELLPFANESFAAVISINMLELSRNPNSAMREIARVLPRDGRAVVTTFNKLSPWGTATIMHALRPDANKRSITYLTQRQLRQIIQAAQLNVHEIKCKAKYLPAFGSGFKIPVTGGFIALLSKDEKPIKKASANAEASKKSRGRD